MLGGLFLCFEGAEKILEAFFHKHEAPSPEDVQQKLETPLTPEEEKAKIKGAVRTDFILSAEIIVLTLGVVSQHPFMTQLITMSLIALLMTLGVYGLVAVIVKIDDAGLYLSKKSGSFTQSVGRGLLTLAPYLMKALSVIGTVAMFLVGGGILTHGFHLLSEWISEAASSTALIPGIGTVVSAVIPTLLNGVIGIIAGMVVVAVVTLFGKLKKAH